MAKQGTCWDGYVQKGMKKKGNRMVPNCVPAGKKVMKAAMGRAAFSETTSKAPGTKMKKESYIGSYMHSELAGKKVSNPSLVKYYGPLLKGFKNV
mgnify:FL=1|tara:strand:- start:219 stop:503 length:285 start_codon:yes stop_codon:yes gene_type:complete